MKIQCLLYDSGPTGVYSQYSIGPFLKGQGLTIGTALRRILLSNLQGLAIIGVRIVNVEHELSVSPFHEDIMEILLNLKQIVLKGDVTEPVLARLTRKETGMILASDIHLPDSITVVNPAHYIGRLTNPNEGGLEMEFLIARGQNYFLSTAFSDVLPVNFLAVDAVFMPVKRVSFYLTQSVKNPSLEQLHLDLLTTGALEPVEALSLSADILETTFGMLKIASTSSIAAAKIELPEEEEEPEEEEIEEVDWKTTVGIERLGLKKRAYDRLKSAKILTLAELVTYSVADLLAFDGFGQTSADHVCERLKDRFDLKLRR
jgi:DNA-directed RNA polymerase subunit alpha